jgi:hypothetical protein
MKIDNQEVTAYAANAPKIQEFMDEIDRPLASASPLVYLIMARVGHEDTEVFDAKYVFYFNDFAIISDGENRNIAFCKSWFDFHPNPNWKDYTLGELPKEEQIEVITRLYPRLRERAEDYCELLMK